jgi:hypothetical protein
MASQQFTNLDERLISIARGSAWFMSALNAVRELELASWCIGAGTIRTLVWDTLHQLPTYPAPGDVDVAYFDPSDLSPERDASLERRLARIVPDLPWEVTNQAAVHHWFEGHFGHAVPPLSSLEEAVASWPEYVTSMGLRLEADDSITVIAPYGLDDLFQMVVRRNPVRVSVETYRQRIAQKRYAERWPKVTVIP